MLVREHRYYISLLQAETVWCWQMVAANVLQSFDEAGLNNADKVAVVGKRFVLASCRAN